MGYGEDDFCKIVIKVASPTTRETAFVRNFAKDRRRFRNALALCANECIPVSVGLGSSAGHLRELLKAFAGECTAPASPARSQSFGTRPNFAKPSLNL